MQEDQEIPDWLKESVDQDKLPQAKPVAEGHQKVDTGKLRAGSTLENEGARVVGGDQGGGNLTSAQKRIFGTIGATSQTPPEQVKSGLPDIPGTRTLSAVRSKKDRLKLMSLKPGETTPSEWKPSR